MYGYVDTDEVFRIKTLYTAFEANRHSKYYFNGEYHNFWEMVIVLDGTLGVTAGSDLFILKKGHFIVFLTKITKNKDIFLRFNI